ncbi:MAG: arginine N-succinyltransferase [Phycisphaerales bacterium]|nr:arginine N-succinyltransferase [Phycisphaerales bacterium]
MFVIRQATLDDVPTLLKLAKMVHFINLPPDKDIIASKIARSRLSFSGQAESERDREFMFVLEDVDSGNVVGTSAVLSCISWPGHPHTFLKVRKRHLFSEDLQSGAVHITLELGTDESGPSEMGGLILAPGYRGHKERLGSLLSQIRFHYIGLHREWFAETVIAELMGALTPDSRTLLWEYLGRRFINLEYAEADRFCQHSKEFITQLFPPGEIWTCLLPAEARSLIGRVGEETKPAQSMLEAQGFRYHDHVDPFDGGPYVGATRDDIPLVQATRTATLGDPVAVTDDRYDAEAFLSYESENGFRALRSRIWLHGDHVSIPAEAAGLLGAQPGETIGVTPLRARSAKATRGATGRQPARAASASAKKSSAPSPSVGTAGRKRSGRKA